MQKTAIYGAQSIALGIYKAIHFLYPENPCIGFIVSSLKDNPSILAGQKVWELSEFRHEILSREGENIQILIATPENLHEEIMAYLDVNGVYNYICMDSSREAKLMEQYFTAINKFPSLHHVDKGWCRAKLCVFQAKFHKDKQMRMPYRLPDWIRPLQVGAELAQEQIAEYLDNAGENISAKNINYCELTGLYWMWKNKLGNKPCMPGEEKGANEKGDYYGLFHYRRILDIREEDLYRISENKVDVILPFPTFHEPDITEHHSRYVRESDWKAMVQALKELQPDYAAAFPTIFSQPYFYNYNIIIARKRILKEYCAWLFPILERTEQLSMPRGWERADRYIGYLGESLLTLYFFYHKDDFNIVHTGRLMLIQKTDRQANEGMKNAI